MRFFKILEQPMTPSNVLCQDFCAKSVLSLIFPSMEAVRQVPQSTAEHQSTVTTGALCPPNDSTLSSAGSPLVSWNKRKVNIYICKKKSSKKENTHYVEVNSSNETPRKKKIISNEKNYFELPIFLSYESSQQLNL